MPDKSQNTPNPKRPQTTEDWIAECERNADEFPHVRQFWLDRAKFMREHELPFEQERAAYAIALVRRWDG